MKECAPKREQILSFWSWSLSEEIWCVGQQKQSRKTRVQESKQKVTKFVSHVKCGEKHS